MRLQQRNGQMARFDLRTETETLTRICWRFEVEAEGQKMIAVEVNRKGPFVLVVDVVFADRLLFVFSQNFPATFAKMRLLLHL